MLTLKVISIVIVYLFFNYAHKIVFPEKYSSIIINNFTYNEDYSGEKRKIYFDFFMRLALIIIEVFVFNKIFKFDYNLIYYGVVIGAFLNVWPAIVYFKLLKIPTNKNRIIILSRYLLFIANAWIIVYFMESVIDKSLSGKNTLFLDNSFFSFMIGLFLTIFPMLIDKIVSQYYYINFPLEIDFFKEEVQLTLKKIRMNEIYVEELYENEIYKHSQKYNLNPKLITYIMSFEDFYRGGYLWQIAEKIYCYYFYDFAIKKDASIGISQMKISNIAKTLKMSPLRFKKRLFNPNFMIRTTCKFVYKILKDYDDLNQNMELGFDIYDYITQEYLGNCENQSAKVYALTLKTLLMGKGPYFEDEN